MFSQASVILFTVGSALGGVSAFGGRACHWRGVHEEGGGGGVCMEGADHPPSGDRANRPSVCILLEYILVFDFCRCSM